MKKRKNLEMTLKEKIRDNLKEAIRGKREKELSVLRLLLSGITSREKEKRYMLSKEKLDLNEEELQNGSSLCEEEIIEVVFSEAKKRKESIDEFKKGGREDLVQKETEELEILKEYLPEQLSEEEIRKIVEETIKELGAESMKEIGKVMSSIMPKVKGKAEGGQISKFAKELLS